jgi:hypothetical protein
VSDDDEKKSIKEALENDTKERAAVSAKVQA